MDLFSQFLACKYRITGKIFVPNELLLFSIWYQENHKKTIYALLIYPKLQKKNQLYFNPPYQ